ncbi:MAG: hypothetical protein ACKO6K_02110, partial [Chitinophagaceae bacterium]
MSQIAFLISKLSEQFVQKASSPQLLVTVKQLEAELQVPRPPGVTHSGTAKVAVVLPAAEFHSTSSSAGFSDVPVIDWKEETLVVESAQRAAKAISAQQPVSAALRQELHEAIATPVTSLNESLKMSVVEVAEVLQETPVRDLKKAIGINDRFTFINELFHGDEQVFEKSIRTLNNFRIYAEAEFWISR